MAFAHLAEAMRKSRPRGLSLDDFQAAGWGAGLSMSGAAQEVDDSSQINFEATGTDGAPGGLRQVATERLAEHRRRRATMQRSAVEDSARSQAKRRFAREGRRGGTLPEQRQLTGSFWPWKRSAL